MGCPTCFMNDDLALSSPSQLSLHSMTMELPCFAEWIALVLLNHQKITSSQEPQQTKCSFRLGSHCNHRPEGQDHHTKAESANGLATFFYKFKYYNLRSTCIPPAICEPT